MNTKPIERRRRGDPASQWSPAWGRRDTDFGQVVEPGLHRYRAGDYMLIARDPDGQETWRGYMPATWVPLP